MAKEDNMIKAQKEESAKKVEYIKKLIDEMVEEKAPVTSYTVWKRSGLSKGFIYTNEEIIAYIKAHKSNQKYNVRKLSTADVLAEKKAISEKENKLHLKRIKELEYETYNRLLNENKVLKEVLSKLQELEKAGLVHKKDF